MCYQFQRIWDPLNPLLNGRALVVSEQKPFIYFNETGDSLDFMKGFSLETNKALSFSSRFRGALVDLVGFLW